MTKGTQHKALTEVRGEDGSRLFQPELKQTTLIVSRNETEGGNRLDERSIVTAAVAAASLGNTLFESATRLEQPCLRRLISFAFSQRIGTLTTGGFRFVTFDAAFPTTDQRRQSSSFFPSKKAPMTL